MRTEPRRLVKLAVWAQILAVLAWLWPIGLGGRMPVGGDVTQFSLGLMAELSRSLKAGRLPLWNELWGFGFPGVGESQMGVYYPPHWLLYGLLAPEVAYAWSLVLHTLWGSLGAYWAARKLGVSEVGSALAGFAWSTCGFFLIHLSHQWGYTTGSWMPWAWGLAWSALHGEGSRRAPFLLAVVLCLQLLPGHFQLAFCTEVGVAILAVEQAGERLWARSGGFGAILGVLAAEATAFVLAALQLWPTLRLARLASSRRDFEYLSGFAVTPLHLVTFLAPGLFERSPLWRLVIWDPFHTSPEEYLGYVGLVPLFLAVGAVLAGFRTSSAVRALAIVGLATLVLALGPYVPGFALLCRLPGFSFFRAPARWMLATSLALSLLAGLGFDALVVWRRPARALVGFAVAAALVPALVVLAVELALASTARPGLPALATGYSRAFDTLPWGEPSVFERTVSAARQPFEDMRVQTTWARQGVKLRDAPRPVFAEQRWAIYREELAGSTLLIVALIAVAPLAGRRAALQAALLGLTFLDLWFVGRHRRVDMSPIATLASQSPVFARLDRAPRGVRTIDPLRNMPMVAGVAPASAYRTLDLPALESLTALAGQNLAIAADRGAILDALRQVGTDFRIFDPATSLALARSDPIWAEVASAELFQDPALAGWLFGKDWVAQQGARVRVFGIWQVPGPTARAWLVPLTPAREGAILGEWSGRPSDVIDALRGAAPMEVRSVDPEHRKLVVHADGPSLLVLSQLADPEWAAELSRAGERRACEPRPAFRSPNGGAWQAIAIPGPGDWTVRLNYRGRDVYRGLIVSAVAWTIFAAAWVKFGRGVGSASRHGGTV